MNCSPCRGLWLLALLPFLVLACVKAQDDDVILDSITVEGDLNSTSATKQTYASLSEAQSALREKLLENYDRGATPPYMREGNDTNITDSDSVYEPVTVEVGINFHRVLDVDVVKSEVDLLTWMRFIWTDSRLAWDPEEYNGLDKMWFWLEDGAGLSETSEIWAPDVELWNQKQSIKTSFSNTYAAVDPDGRVFWSRPGHLNPICKFRGLHNFPFDNLVCVVELGSWSYSGKFMRLGLFEDTGFSVGGSGTSGEAFSEFTLRNVSAELVIYPPYPSDPLADWPVLLYSISFERSWEPYIRGYLVSQLIFNLVGFACFWLPIPSGERLGLAITAMLSAVAADLVVVSKLPSASELTWMQKFSMVSQVFAAFCVIEGVVVSYFFYQTSANLVPSYLACIFNRVKRMSFKERKKTKKLGSSNGSSRDNLGASTDSEGQYYYDDSPSASNLESSRSIKPRDADDFQSRSEIRNNTKWKKWAATIDDFARIVVPSVYVVIISVFLSEVTNNMSEPGIL